MVINYSMYSVSLCFTNIEFFVLILHFNHCIVSQSDYIKSRQERVIQTTNQGENMNLVFNKSHNEMTDTEQYWVKEVKEWNRNSDYNRARWYTSLYMGYLKNNGIVLK